jgi:hypothetical protein
MVDSNRSEWNDGVTDSAQPRSCVQRWRHTSISWSIRDRRVVVLLPCSTRCFRRTSESPDYGIFFRLLDTVHSARRVCPRPEGNHDLSQRRHLRSMYGNRAMFVDGNRRILLRITGHLLRPKTGGPTQHRLVFNGRKSIEEVASTVLGNNFILRSLSIALIALARLTTFFAFRLRSCHKLKLRKNRATLSPCRSNADPCAVSQLKESSPACVSVVSCNSVPPFEFVEHRHR